jgi:membrane-associated phospholipid phosphatase
LLQSKEYRHFRIAAAFSIGLSVLVAAFLLMYGKERSFLLINHSYNPVFDYLFQYLTYLGDGIIWVPLFVYTIVYKREFLVAIIAALVICTVFTHFLKRVVFPEELRPIGVLTDRVRTIEGLYVNRIHSFPSGHTSTAFTLALLLAFRLAKPFWTIFFPLIAFLVGYSRVYLAQHFVTDVFAGSLVGIVSAYLSLMVYLQWKKRRANREDAKTREQV